MGLQKLYTHNNNRQIWKILISESDQLLIEERDLDTKEAFYHCIQAETGKYLLKDLQFEEKVWIGSEGIYDDILFIHKYGKPDMPAHKGIIAYSIPDKETMWTSGYAFAFYHGGNVYAFREGFEERKYFVLNGKTGEEIEELSASAILELQDKIDENEKYKSLIFPEAYKKDGSLPAIDLLIKDAALAGDVEYVIHNGTLIFNFHMEAAKESYVNALYAYDMESGKKLLEETLNANARAYAPDSFFIKNGVMFALKEKDELLVFSVE
jgi:hypothetical protein